MEPPKPPPYLLTELVDMIKHLQHEVHRLTRDVARLTGEHPRKTAAKINITLPADHWDFSN